MSEVKTKDSSAEEINFSSYSDKEISKESVNALKEFSLKHPHIKEELINKAKNYMANTIYDENQSREYINWVKSTLKYISRYF